ncbi:MAG TPA: septum formation initiator family protein [Candidatus Limnocylindrales bacterium]|nr:septum formation initiator family protein [Candidatus Limnocylindrales bacterium]
MSRLAGRFRERRGAAAAVFGLFVAGGVVMLFAGTLARATELEQEAARARAEIAALEARLEAGRAEVEFLKNDAFVEQQARVAGFGSKPEQPFRLPADAPSPPPVVPLGTSASDAVVSSPFDAWMALLFGS